MPLLSMLPGEEIAARDRRLRVVLEEQPNNPELLFEHGQCLTLLNQRGEATERYSAAIAAWKNPNDNVFRTFVVWALLNRNFDLATALAAERWPDYPSVRLAVGDSSQRDRAAILWTLCDDCAVHFGFPAAFFSKFDEVMGLRWIDTLLLFLAFRNRHPTVRGSVFFNTDDIGREPGLAFCDFRSEYTLIPDCGFVAARGLSDFKRRLEKAPTWSNRRPIAFWRGATTGSGYLNWRDLPRVKLSRLSHDHPSRLDAAITAIVQIHPNQDEDELRSTVPMAPFIDAIQFAGYKYLIDIDGNTSAWGLINKLCTGSVVLKVTSERSYRQWYYDRLQPWRNFVPVETDLSDLIEKIAWLQDNDGLARALGEKSRDLALSMTIDSELRQNELTILKILGS